MHQPRRVPPGRISLRNRHSFASRLAAASRYAQPPSSLGESDVAGVSIQSLRSVAACDWCHAQPVLFGVLRHNQFVPVVDAF